VVLRCFTDFADHEQTVWLSLDTILIFLRFSLEECASSVLNVKAVQ